MDASTSRQHLLITPGAAPGTEEAEHRRSRVAEPGERLLHADLHNHTLFSDGRGPAEQAFASMREAGLDVAAITDHSFGECDPANTIAGEDWVELGALADAADEPGRFVAIRGFEWSSHTIGHMNVWGGRGYVPPLPLLADGVAADIAVADPGPADHPVAIAAFHEWLLTHTDAGTADGEDALLGFNHPGREPGRFGEFHHEPALTRRVVGLEMFNRGDDYLFERVDTGLSSPLVDCLEAGWRPGLTGVTDEHKPIWGTQLGLGRTGMWARETSRAGVREAMLRRRLFATRERDLRADATANGVPMGSAVPDAGTLTIAVDLGGDAVTGRRVRVQALASGRPLPRVVTDFDATVGASPITFDVERSAVPGGWLVLRVTDPDAPADLRARGHAPYAGAGRTLAYLSPFFLEVT